jgi:hypothetical protein
MRSMHAVPVITLCCAPDWMTRVGKRTSTYPNAPPTAAHIADFAALARQIALRYPDVRYYQVWNEMKGYWNPQTNNWDYVAYTRLYNAVYRSLKAVNSRIRIGGPYLVVDGNGDALTPGNRAVLTYWLAHKLGADFLVLDHSAVPYHAPKVPPAATILRGTDQFERIVHLMRQLTSLPVWWAEDYYDSNFYRLGHATYAFQNVALSSITFHELLAGSAATLRPQPQGYAPWPYRGDQQSLFSDTRVASGGRPFPYYYSFKSFHTDFSPGTRLFATRTSSQDIEVLASATHVMLINKRPSSVVLYLNGGRLTLAPYDVRTVTLPAP